jgi:hypothetical protein
MRHERRLPLAHDSAVVVHDPAADEMSREPKLDFNTVAGICVLEQ